LIGRINALGYVPQTEFVLYDLGSEQKEDLLKYHREKLAIAFVMIHAVEGKCIRIMKNLRICGDCHVFMKLVSKSEGKMIIIRDLAPVATTGSQGWDSTLASISEVCGEC
jgi:hypothetical protein